MDDVDGVVGVDCVHCVRFCKNFVRLCEMV